MAGRSVGSMANFRALSRRPRKRPARRLARVIVPSVLSKTASQIRMAGDVECEKHVTTKKKYVRVENGEKVTTNTVEGYFGLLKRGINGVYHHVGKRYVRQEQRDFRKLSCQHFRFEAVYYV